MTNVDHFFHLTVATLMSSNFQAKCENVPVTISSAFKSGSGSSRDNRVSLMHIITWSRLFSLVDEYEP